MKLATDEVSQVRGKAIPPMDEPSPAPADIAAAVPFTARMRSLESQHRALRLRERDQLAEASAARDALRGGFSFDVVEKFDRAEETRKEAAALRAVMSEERAKRAALVRYALGGHQAAAAIRAMRAADELEKACAYLVEASREIIAAGGGGDVFLGPGLIPLRQRLLQIIKAAG